MFFGFVFERLFELYKGNPLILDNDRISRGDHNHIRKALRKRIKEEPDHPSALFSLGKSLSFFAKNEKEEEKLSFFLNKMAYNLLTKEEAYALKLEFNAIKNRIEPSTDLVVREILGSIELLITLLNVNVMLKAYFDKEIYLEQLDNCIFSLTNYLKVHSSLWNARNKEEGYAFSALRLQQLIEILQKLKLKQNKIN